VAAVQAVFLTAHDLIVVSEFTSFNSTATEMSELCSNPLQLHRIVPNLAQFLFPFIDSSHVVMAGKSRQQEGKDTRRQCRTVHNTGSVGDPW
jgi:hypothetical protein